MRIPTLPIALVLALAGSLAPQPVQLAAVSGPATPYPILFVTQPPIRQDFVTINSTFGNHKPDAASAGRGGDLWIRYSDGTLRNLTLAAGFGVASGFQGSTSIEVRDPAVHWDGTRALFAMVVGAQIQLYQYPQNRWQLYEISNFLDPNATPVITKVPGQLAAYNNVMPAYGTNGRILFASDTPRGGPVNAHLYPQLDEYEEAAANTGLWSLDPASGDLHQLEHSPSGSFNPIVDSFGRVVFHRWDHLKRDQQADTDWKSGLFGVSQCNAQTYVGYCPFNYSGELASSVPMSSQREIFPEPRAARTDLLAGTNLAGGAEFQQFFPWAMNEDGTELETLNHLGRHELGGSYTPAVFTDDPNLTYYYGGGGSQNTHLIRESFAQIKEDPAHPGTYYGVNSQEFGTHNSGQIISMTAPPGMSADLVKLTYVTHADTESSANTAANSGKYRDPLPLSDGTLVAAHTAQKANEATSGASIFDFRIKTLSFDGAYWNGASVLTPGISKTLSYLANDAMVGYSGLLWELQPVEVRPRALPLTLQADLYAPEQQAFAQAGVDVAQFQAWLAQNNLALLVNRDATTRDNAERQQPFNLRVAGAGYTGVQTIGAPGKIYDIAYLQVLQGDLIRGVGFTGLNSPPRSPGRRVLAEELHDGMANNPPNAAPVPGAFQIAADGSSAGFVPANRALSWQTIDAQGTPVVRERYWLSFAPGEVRACASCHGINDVDQAGNPEPQNVSQALLDLLATWKAANPGGPQPTPSGTPSGQPSPTPTPTPTNTPISAATQTATPTATPVAQEPATATPTSVSQETATATPTATQVAQEPATATPTQTAPPTETPAPTATATPTVLPTATPTVLPTATPTKTPTATPTVVPSATPTATPSSTPVPSATPFTLRINFQPASAPVPPGYLPDGGATYGNRGNGYTYGWSSKATSFAWDRNSALSPDQRYDTLIHTQAAGNRTWEIAVPSGTYAVFVVAGDPSEYGSVYRYRVENTLVVSGTPTSANRWVSGSATVQVTDGRLTLSNAAGASNNKVDFIEITRTSGLALVVLQPSPLQSVYFPMMLQ